MTAVVTTVPGVAKSYRVEDDPFYVPPAPVVIPKPETEMDRRKLARRIICMAANTNLMRVGPRPKLRPRPYTMRHINEAVFKCRQRNLVPDYILTAAGFNVA